MSKEHSLTIANNKKISQEELVKKSKEFYQKVDRSVYSGQPDLQNHAAYNYLVRFIEDYQIQEKRCLEIGSSTGIFQDLVSDYTGLDVSESLKKYYHKRYFQINNNGDYPFENNSFDAIWSFAVHEHIPNLQQALMEIKRILKRGGLLFFWPAWFCSTWAAEGYAVRPYKDFGLKGKLIKLLIPVRSTVIWRSLSIFPKRIYRHLFLLFGRRYDKILYKKIKANYEHFWISDSDACNSIDSHDAILWFLSNGFTCISHPTHLSVLLVRHEPIILKKV
jgi:SAM-dependent methyltransferase